MKNSEFDMHFNNLILAFGKEMKPAQIEIYFEKFKDWDARKFKWVIERLIEESDRFPTIASVFKKGFEYVEQSANGQKTECEFCDSKGLVTVRKPVKDMGAMGEMRIMGIYETTFFCPDCDNGALRISGAYCRKYSKDLELEGCELTWHYRGRVSKTQGVLKCEPWNKPEPRKLIDLKNIVKSVDNKESAGKEFVRENSLRADKLRDFAA